MINRVAERERVVRRVSGQLYRNKGAKRNFLHILNHVSYFKKRVILWMSLESLPMLKSELLKLVRMWVGRGVNGIVSANMHIRCFNGGLCDR